MTDAPRTLVVAFDVSRLSATERDQLTLEVMASRERSAEHPTVPGFDFLSEVPARLVEACHDVGAEGMPDDETLGLMVTLDGAQEAFVPLRDGDDAYNREAERGALDRAYELKTQAPDSVVAVVYVDETHDAEAADAAALREWAIFEHLAGPTSETFLHVGVAAGLSPDDALERFRSDVIGDRFAYDYEPAPDGPQDVPGILVVHDGEHAGCYVARPKAEA